MLKQKIQQDLKEAIKNREEIKSSVTQVERSVEINALRLLTLRLLMAAILNREKEKRYILNKEKSGISENDLTEKAQLDNQETIEVVFSEIKKRKEAIKGFEKGQREDLVKKEAEELKILKKYLPEQLNEEELKELTIETIKEVKAETMRDIGKVMAILMPKIKGKAETSQAVAIIKQILCRNT